MLSKLSNTQRKYIAFILLLITVLILNVMIKTTINDLYYQTKEKELANSALLIENHIRTIKEELFTITTSPTEKILSSTYCQESSSSLCIDSTLYDRLTSDITVLLHINEKGEILEVTSDRYAGLTGLNVYKKDYFTIPKETKRPYVTDIILEGENKEIIVSVPLFDNRISSVYPDTDARFLGVLATKIDIKELINTYRPQIMQKNEELLVTDSQGNIILSIENELVTENYNRQINGKQIIKEDIRTNDKTITLTYIPQKRINYIIEPIILLVILSISIAMIIPNPRTKKKEESLPPQEKSNPITLIDQEYAIISYIIQKQQENKAVYFKEISKEFNITKPTTKIRIESLKNKELITIEQEGRLKKINLTSKGKKFKIQ